MNDAKVLNRIMGCMVGGAVGDALGYPVEFDTRNTILKRYGEDGITSYELCEGKALISDDTQMTMFTANGLMLAQDKHSLRSFVESIYKAYLEWLATQRRSYNKDRADRSSCWIMKDDRLWKLRAPGNTCLNSLSSKTMGSAAKPINDSKGCGGVMRVAPVGIYLPKFNKSPATVMIAGSEAAAITHGNPLGYLPAGLLALIVSKSIYRDNQSLESIIRDSLKTMRAVYTITPDVTCLESLINKAIDLANNNEVETIDAITQLGKGWVGEEALAIAIYCALSYRGTFSYAVQAAVNHDGDSDSTGAITGNILGAYIGYSEIESKFIENLECIDILKQLSLDMFMDIEGYSQRYQTN